MKRLALVLSAALLAGPAFAQMKSMDMNTEKKEGVTHKAKGVVTRVDPAVTEGTVIVDVELRSALPAGARPQLPVEGVIYLSRVSNTLYVGKPSYVKTNGVMTVYKLDAEGRYAKRVTIKAGKLSINYLQILEGLNAGDRIITSEVGEWQHEERILIN